MPAVAVVLVVVLGGGLFALGLYQRRKLQASLSWPQAVGRVTWTGIKESESGNSEDGYSTTFSPEVVYQFEAHGAVYTGSRIGFVSTGHGNPAKAAAVLAGYPVNSPVTVYFNPQKPSDCVLVRRASGSSVIMWVGAAMVVLAVASLFR
jgi:hypothetical protein